MAAVAIDENNDLHPMGSSDFMLVDEDSEPQPTWRDWMTKLQEQARDKARLTFRRKVLFKRLPVLRWLPLYNAQDAVGDLVAGITVGLTVIPQALAYANIAGLPPQYGLYSAFFGSMLYILFGSCKDVSMGPTAIISLMTYQTVNGKGPEHAILLCFFSGLILLLMGLLGLGFIIDFISGPVASGFTSAVALVIITSQVKDLLGIPATGNTFVEMWASIFENIDKTRLWDPILGAICITVLLLLRHMSTVKIGPKDEALKTTPQKIFNKILWLVSMLRNALIVFTTGAITYAFYVNGMQPFLLIGEVPAGLPGFKPPPFGYTTEDGVEVSFGEMMSNLGAGIVVVPLLSIMENISVCKAFSAGKAVDATQEMISIGIANIGNSFVQAFPGSGALARSAVFNASGVRTALGNIYSGLLVILSLIFFTELFFYIPKAALASVIIAAVVFMIEFKVIKPMWKVKRVDLIPCLVTFICCLAISIPLGILIGIGVNLLFILRQAARPKIMMHRAKSRGGTEYLLLTPDRCLLFPSVDYMRNLVTKHSSGTKKDPTTAIPVVIDCSHIYGADYTAAGVIQSMTRDFASRGQALLFFNLKPSVVAVFEGLQPEQFVYYYDDDDLDMLLHERWKLPLSKEE